MPENADAPIGAPDARRFLHAILPERREDEVYRVEVFPRPADQANNFTRIDALAAYLSKHGRSANAYVALATFPAGGNDRQAEHAMRVACLWADLDCGADKPYATQADAQAALDAFPLRPHAVLNSGHGLWAYWPLAEPAEGKDLDRAIALVRGLAEVLRADPSVADRARITRVPGTVNVDSFERRKDGRDHPVLLLHLDEDAPRYGLDDFTAAGVPELRQATRAQRGIAADGERIPQGSRNQTLTSLAGSIRRPGMSLAAIEAALLAENDARCDPPLAPDEVRDIAASISRYAPEPKLRAATRRAKVASTPPPAGGLPDGMRRMADVAPERVRWLWPGRIPLGKVTLISGDPDLGKSLLALDLAARVTRGHTMPDGTLGLEGGAVIISLEDGPGDTIRPRLEAAGADLDRIILIEEVGDGEAAHTPSIPEDIDAIRYAVKEAEALLVIIDPLAAALSDETDSHVDHRVRRSLVPLKLMAEETGIAVVVIRHLNKSGGTNAKYRGGGSIGITAAARAELLVAEDPDDSELRVLARIKGNLAAPVPSMQYVIGVEHVSGVGDVPVIVWRGESTRTAGQLLAAADDDGGELAEVKGWLADLLSDGPMLMGAVESARKAAGLGSPRTLRRAREALGVVSEGVYEPGRRGATGYRWSLL